jgi:pimeloyl-ACP methyl ester carboxylesterase
MPVIKHSFVHVEDLKIFIRQAGDPSAPTVILLPGYPSSSRAYVRLIDRLATRWHTVAIDYPGFGRSDPLPEPPTFDRLADQRVLDLPGRSEYMKALLWDYKHNPPLYETWQTWLRTRQPKMLAVWGRNDPFFIPAGAEAFARDVPATTVLLLDTGHFALEEEVDTIAEATSNLLNAAFA